MAFYKLCDCGRKNKFEQRGLAPRKCSNCGRNLVEYRTMDEAFEEEAVTGEKMDEQVCESETKQFYYSLNAMDNSFEIAIPVGGGIVGRNALGAEYLKSNKAVSREHISVTYRGRLGLLVEDKSRFGTFINDHQVVSGAPRLVKSGDIVKLCNLELKVTKQGEEYES